MAQEQVGTAVSLDTIGPALLIMTDDSAFGKQTIAFDIVLD